MINGFEEYTSKLNDKEKKMLPIIASGLSTKKGIEKAVKNDEIIKGMKNIGYHIGNARIRKLINIIRRYGLVNFLIASSKGYHVASSRDEVVDYIKSLKQREDAIREVRLAMTKQLDVYDNLYPYEKNKNK
jgi:hypothetical protein